MTDTKPSDCPSCNGLNTSCPDGCGRDPLTGELDGSTLTKPSDVDGPYLIRKQGYWYRPNARGYTDSAIQAGRYSLADAECYTHPNGKDGPRDGMHYVHEDDVVDPDWQAFRELRTTLAAQQARIEALELDLRARDCLQDSAYQAGMKHGWNCAITDDRAAYDASMSSEHIAELRRINEARAALKEPTT